MQASDNAGKPHEVINALQESEARYQLIAANMNDVIWTMAIDGTITYVSPSVERVRGFTPEEAMAQPVGEILCPESLTVSTNYFLYLLEVLAAGGKPEPYRGDQQYWCKDGSTYWGDVFAYPEFNTDGSFKQLVGVTRDVTERRSQEEELKKAHAELARQRDELEARVHDRTRELAAARDLAEQASKTKSAILSNMNHELRTPLNHIIGYSGLLKHELSHSKSLNRLVRLEQSAQQLLRLVENLLDAALLETNQIHIVGADFELHPLLEKLQAQVLHSAAAKAIVLELDLCASLPMRLHGDGYRVWQVLSELIDNAVKFSSQGPIVMRICQSSASANLVNLRFEVLDQGIGIALELQASMFEFFLQGDSSSARQYGGVGLGLGLCHRVVNLMAGEFGFSSEPGRGSCFWVDLPFGVAAETAADAKDSQAREVRKQGQELLALLQHDHEYAYSYFNVKAPLIRAYMGDFVFLFEDSLRDGDFTLAADILSAKLGEISS